DVLRFGRLDESGRGGQGSEQQIQPRQLPAQRNSGSRKQGDAERQLQLRRCPWQLRSARQRRVGTTARRAAHSSGVQQRGLSDGGGAAASLQVPQRNQHRVVRLLRLLRQSILRDQQ